MADVVVMKGRRRTLLPQALAVVAVALLERFY